MSLEEEFFNTFNLGTPVITKWYYEGYYEDYDWNKKEEDCSDILKKYKITVEDLNEKIQSVKQKARDNKLDAYKARLDAVSTTFGLTSGSYMKYPELTTDSLLNLIYLLNKKGELILPRYKSKNHFNDGILKRCIKLRNNNMFRKEVREIFKKEV